MSAETGVVVSRLAAALGDRYRIEGELGRGAMATVFLARDLKHDRPIALKVLHPEHTASIAASRFLQEIHVAAHLTHPNVVSLHDSGEAGDYLYYVMPYLAGESLRDRLRRERQLPVEDALAITRDLADALAYAHRCGIVHRDIKPENILLSEGHALLTDFGIARAAAEAATGSLTSSGTFVGTPLYASPEQSGEGQRIDGRSDLYSLGCVVYEMLAGEPPFTAPTAQAVLAKHALEPRPSVRTVRDTVPPHVDEALRQAMARVPADRFASVSEFAQALTSEHGTGAGRAAAPSILRRPGRAAMAAAVGAAAFLLLWAVLPPRDGKPPAGSYGGLPTWSGWSDVSGENFLGVAALDSQLVVYVAGADSLYLLNGEDWTGIGIPEQWSLHSFAATLRRGLPALLRDPRTHNGRQYAWLAVGIDGLREVERLPPFAADHEPANLWTDGRETVAWLDGVEKLEGGRWVREPRTAGFIRKLWGVDFRHRFALPGGARDSLLAYDGISWRNIDVFPRPSPLRPEYRAAGLLADGTSVVLGQACDSLACEPVVLQQDSSRPAWLRVIIPAAVGIPARQRVHHRGECHPARFVFAGAAGRGRDDYYVWGEWVRCEPLPRMRVFSGCSPGWPCTWRVTAGRLEPVTELLGVVVHTIQPGTRTLHLLAIDGTVWRRVADTWRPVHQVPGLLHRLVAASGSIVVQQGEDGLTYEPGASDTVSAPIVSQIALGGSAAHPGIRSLAVRDSTIALLTHAGTMHRITCGLGDEFPGAESRTVACGEQGALQAPAGTSAVAPLPDASVLAVGAGTAARWQGAQLSREDLPHSAQRDSLWGVSVAADGTATVIGRHHLLQRAPDGSWTTLRTFPEGSPADGHFAVLPDGNVVVGGDWLRVWSRTADAQPLAVLRRPVVGEPRVSALHVLPDGRLVAGFSFGDVAGVRGRLEIWSVPAAAAKSEMIDLPLNVSVTSLADDGHSLLVAGRGGTLTIPLEALPRGRRP